MNLDNRSMRLNDENALVIHDRETAAALETMFVSDLGRAEEITLESHAARSLWERVRERITRGIAPLL
jgi:cardiolipin synthase